MPIWNPVDKTELVFVGVKKPNIIVKINPYTLIKKSSYKSEGSIESLAWSPDGNNIAIVEGLFKTIRLIVIDKDFKSKNIIGILGFSNLTSNIIWKNNEKK
jgi:hypothetical protein